MTDERPPILATADLHLWNPKMLGGPMVRGLNRRCVETARVIKAAAVLTAQKRGALIVAGDVFDAPRPSPQVVRALMDALAPLAHDERAHGVFVMVGNHDRPTDLIGDNALAPLGQMPGVTVVDAPYIHNVAGRATLFVPPARRGDLFEDHLRGVIEAMETRVELLVIHAGVEDNLTAPFLRGSRGAINVLRLAALAKLAGAKEVVAGDWHEPRMWGVDGVKITQCGALVPTGWDNPGTGYGRVHEVGTAGRYYMLNGPRFLVAEDERAAANMLRTIFGGPGGRDVYYVRVAVSPQDYAAARLRLEAIADETGNHVHVVKQAAAQADGDVRRRVVAGVDEALARSTWALEVDDDVRQRVLDRARRYIAAAGGE